MGRIREALKQKRAKEAAAESSVRLSHRPCRSWRDCVNHDTESVEATKQFEDLFPTLDPLSGSSSFGKCGRKVNRRAVLQDS